MNADIAEKYVQKYHMLTGARRIAIFGLKKDLDNVWAEFKDKKKAIGLTIRSIQICPGTRPCKKAKQDSPGLGFALDTQCFGEPAPAGFKRGISGCENCCCDPWMKDLGFFGTDQDSRQLRAERAAGPRVGRMIATGLT